MNAIKMMFFLISRQKGINKGCARQNGQVSSCVGCRVEHNAGMNQVFLWCRLVKFREIPTANTNQKYQIVTYSPYSTKVVFSKLFY